MTRRCKILTTDEPNRVILALPNGQLRHFWCARAGGYVYEEFPGRPGTLGWQVCDGLDHAGSALWVSHPTRLSDAVRREWRSAARDLR